MFGKDFGTEGNGELKPGKVRVRQRINGLKSKIRPKKFGWEDVAQQFVGAFLLSAPFIVTEEVWNLANQLTPMRAVFLVTITMIASTLILYYSKYQKIAVEEVSEHIPVPRRLVVLFMISYGVAFLMLWTIGVIGVVITDPVWITKLVVFVGFFASVGAAAADVLR
jgi:uncharacterized membrane protein